MDHTYQNLKNPYMDLYLWCKEELLDLNAVEDAANGRDNLQFKVEKLTGKRIKWQTDIDNRVAGNKKKTLKEQFVGQKSEEELKHMIEGADKEVHQLKQLQEIVTIYIATKVLPRFRKEKATTYKKIIEQFALLELNN